MEVGLKTTLADGRLSVTAALYNIDWEDIIVRTSATTPNIPGIVPFPLSYDDNAGTASSQGLELELRGVMSDVWSWALGGSFMWEADIGSASTGNVARVAGSTSVGVQPGNRLPASPKFSGYASLVRDFQLAGFDATARLDAYAVTRQFKRRRQRTRNAGLPELRRAAGVGARAVLRQRLRPQHPRRGDCLRAQSAGLRLRAGAHLRRRVQLPPQLAQLPQPRGKQT